MAVSIKAPVGEKKRITEGPAVKNNLEDVKTVQLMLFANGFKGPITGKCTPGMAKAIQAFQKSKLKYKKPDGVVDPCGTTWRAGLAKLEAKIKTDQALLDNMVLVRENGKEKYISKAEFKRGQDALKKKIVEKANRMYSDAESWVEFSIECSRTAAGADGFMMSFTSFIVSSVSSGKSEPPYGPLTDARSQASELKSLAGHNDPDWKKVLAQDKKATKAHKKGKDAFAKFIKTRIDTAGAIIGKLEVVRELNFAVVEVYITAQLIAKGKSPAQAHAIAAAGTESMKSSADQLGNYLAGNKVTWDSAMKKVAVDTAFAGASGFVGGKLTGKFAAVVKGNLLKTLQPFVGKTVSQKALDAFIGKILTSKAAQEVITTGTKETIGLFKPVIEKGRMPNKKEVQAAMIITLTAGLLKSAPIKGLQAFANKMPDKVQDALSTKIVPAITNSTLNQMRKKLGDAAVDKLPDAFKTKMFEEIAHAVKGKSAEIYALKAAEGSTGDTKESQLYKLGDEGLRKDAALRKSIEDMVKSKVEKKLKSME